MKKWRRPISSVTPSQKKALRSTLSEEDCHHQHLTVNSTVDTGADTQIPSRDPMWILKADGIPEEVLFALSGELVASTAFVKYVDETVKKSVCNLQTRLSARRPAGERLSQE